MPALARPRATVVAALTLALGLTACGSDNIAAAIEQINFDIRIDRHELIELALQCFGHLLPADIFTEKALHQRAGQILVQRLRHGSLIQRETPHLNAEK